MLLTRLRRSFALGALAALGGLGAAPASAAITSSYASNTLTVTGDGADDTVVVTCSANVVKVNGANPDTGAVGCSAPSSLVVNGGGGADLLDISAVTSPPFTALGASTVEALAALHRRRLNTAKIVRLYPVIQSADVEQALDLERQLQPDLALVA